MGAGGGFLSIKLILLVAQDKLRDSPKTLNYKLGAIHGLKYLNLTDK